MKKTLFFSFLVLIYVATILFSILYINSFNNRKETPNYQISDNINIVNYDTFLIEHADVALEITINGVTIIPQEAYSEVLLDTFAVKSGDFISYDTLIGYHDDMEVKANVLGRVVNVNEDSVRIINYENCYVMSHIPPSYMQYVNFDKEYSSILNGITVNLKLTEINYSPLNNEFVTAYFYIDTLSEIENLYLFNNSTSTITLHKEIYKETLRVDKNIKNYFLEFYSGMTFMGFIKDEEGKISSVFLKVGFIGDKYVQLITNKDISGKMLCLKKL
ncbi:MAG TPA: hypothetical protein VIK84_06580 [Haloplasmataceae bacterium]